MAPNFRYRIAMETNTGSVTAECSFFEEAVTFNDISVSIKDWAQSVIDRFGARAFTIIRAEPNGKFLDVDADTLSLTIPS